MVDKALKIILEVAQERGIPLVKLLVGSKKRHLVAARKEAIRRVHEETNLSLNGIAEVFNYKDHTTVLHHLNNYIAGE